MIELNMPIDEIIFCDTTVEFPEMYEHINKVEKYIGRKITRLRAEHDFEYYLLEHKPKVKNIKNKTFCGYGFPSSRFRWCTARLKTDVVNKYLRKISKEYYVVQYIGIAADESKRIKDKIYPLVEWGWTEKDCLEYCYSKGFTWGGLYEKFHRLSCWCCPLQSLDSLRSLYNNFPHLWKQLESWELNKSNGSRTFTPSYSVFELEIRFKLEEEREKQGLPIGRNREFHKELRKRIEEYNKEK